MGKHKGKDEGIDQNSPEGIKLRLDIEPDMSDERISEDVKIIDQGYNQRYDTKGNKK